MSGRDRAIALRRATLAAVCDRAVPWAHGTTVRATHFPTSYDHNELRVEGADPGVAAAELIAVADEQLAGLKHRQIEVEDEAAGRRLRPAFRALGWDTSRLVWMELVGTASVGAAAVGAEITETPLARTRPMREAWFLSSGWMPSAEVAREFMGLEEQVGERRGTRALIAWGAGGEPIGYVAFSAAHGTAEVEQAYVVPGHRGAGVGGALVAAAVAAAGAATTFIVADDEERAKGLYARLGFEPVWLQHQFTLRDAAAARRAS